MTEEGGIKIKSISSGIKYRRQKLQIRAKKPQKLVLGGGVPTSVRMRLYLQMGHTDEEIIHAQGGDSVTGPLGECPKAPSIE